MAAKAAQLFLVNVGVVVIFLILSIFASHLLSRAALALS